MVRGAGPLDLGRLRRIGEGGLGGQQVRFQLRDAALGQLRGQGSVGVGRQVQLRHDAVAEEPGAKPGASR